MQGDAPTYRKGQWIFATNDDEQGKAEAIAYAEGLKLTPEDVRLCRVSQQIALIMKKDIYIIM